MPIDYVKLAVEAIQLVQTNKLASTTNAKVSPLIQNKSNFSFHYHLTNANSFPNHQIIDPCDGNTACGICAECKVKNHVAQCSCPTNFLGNPLVACTQVALTCDGTCECDEIGYCTKSCHIEADCACGETCANGKCRNKCSSHHTCAQGQICTKGACLPGCRSSNDCASTEVCTNKKCQDACKEPNGCGQDALCRASDRRKLCVCPDGYQGDPLIKCVPYECQSDDDCESNKKCSVDGACRNPCLEHKACGLNAQCRVVERKPHCTCPPGYIGNGLIECKQGGNEDCLKNPCGDNTKCRNIPEGFECSCLPGCIGDATKGCTCEDPLINLCKTKLCGAGAQCRVVNGNKAQCYCPPERSAGDPTIECIKFDWGNLNG